MFNICDNYFSVLKNYGFYEQEEYHYSREIYKDYIKENIIISIVFDGSYWINFIRTKKNIPDYKTGKIKYTDIDNKDLKYYDLSILDKNKILYNSINFDNKEENVLLYYSKLLMNNPEILNGNMNKFKLTYRLLKLIGLK